MEKLSFFIYNRYGHSKNIYRFNNTFLSTLIDKLINFYCKIINFAVKINKYKNVQKIKLIVSNN